MIDANNYNNKYDLQGPGESTQAKSAGLQGIPEEATDPALCGMVSGAAVGSVPVGGVATVTAAPATTPPPPTTASAASPCSAQPERSSPAVA